MGLANVNLDLCNRKTFPCHRDKKQLADIVVGGYVGLFVCKACYTHFKETVFLDFFRKCRVVRVKRWVDT